MLTFAVCKGLRNANPGSEVAGASEIKRDRYITDAELGNDEKPTSSGRAQLLRDVLGVEPRPSITMRQNGRALTHQIVS